MMNREHVDVSGKSDPSSAVPDQEYPGDVLRLIARGFGQLLMTLGVLLLLLCVYDLWWTNVESARTIATVRSQILADWARPIPGPDHANTSDPGSEPQGFAQPDYGSGFALLYIPRMRDKVWGLPILEGTSKAILAQGAGHYRTTAMVGAIGNFAIAAHRSTHNEPFAHIDDLRVGDKVFVQTRDTWYVYTLREDNPNLSPLDVWVIDPVPGQVGAVPKKRLLTMTTCTPRYGSTGRWAWWGELVATRSASQGPPPGVSVTT